MDLEFNGMDIASFQLNFDWNDNELNKYIFVIKYELLNNFSKKMFIKYILINKKVYKIIHGAASNDIPKLIYHHLKTQKKMTNFIKSYFDTRALCELLIKKNPATNKLCGIYELLYKLKFIDIEKYNELNTNFYSQGHLKDNMINIKNLSNELEKYIVYDVIYLIDVFKYFVNELKYAYKIVSEFNRLIIFDSIIDNLDKLNKIQIKYNFFNIYFKYKTVIDALNTNIVYITINKKKENMQLSKLFEKIFEKYNNQDKKKKYIDNKNIFFIENYKKFIQFYFKIITYNYIANISNNPIIYINKKIILPIDTKISLNNAFEELIDFIKENKLKIIKNIFKNYKKFLIKELKESIYL